MSQSRPPRPDVPGWFPDPTGRFDERFWLRGRWTSRIRYGDAEAIDPCAVDAATLSSPRQPVTGEDHGWRPDPIRRFPQRWWTGDRFTRAVRVGPAVATDSECPPAPSRRQRARANRADRRTDTDAPGWYPDPDGDGERFWDGYVWTAKWRPQGRHQRHSMRGWMPRTVVRALVGLVMIVLVVLVVVLLVVVL